MDRREALKTTSYVVGYSLTASALTALLQGCRTKPVEMAEETWTPEFFEPEQIDLISELSDTIIPETDTPGAKAVNVAAFIDDEMRYQFEPEDQYKFIEGLNSVQSYAQKTYGKSFQECSTDERSAILQHMEDAGGDQAEFFGVLKRLTYDGYFTSEKIGEEVLEYLPVPGPFVGCTDIDAATRIWSL